ncbi:Com family DNA-binding transcriptional regulator [Methylophaga sp. OBS4]|uniref:Com family DNA-binding transcriptional regulator n=1 Tax=Methylophaga sp. OBS4 TaxID=2991935 RepID=UPI003A4C6D2A
MKEIRCGACGRKLGEGIFIELQIKCARCKTMNYLRVKHPEPEHHECQQKENTRGDIPNRKPVTA